MPRYSEEQKAEAIALVDAGERSRCSIAEELGCSDSTVRRWIAAAERRETAGEKTLAAKAEALSEQIKATQSEVRQALLARLSELIPDTESLKDVATAYGIVTDKELLAAGKPTQIHGQAIAIPETDDPSELERTAEELRRRRVRA